MPDPDPKLISSSGDCESRSWFARGIIILVMALLIVAFLLLGDGAPGEYNFFKGSKNKIAVDALVLTSIIGSVVAGSMLKTE